MPMSSLLTKSTQTRHANVELVRKVDSNSTCTCRVSYESQHELDIDASIFLPRRRTLGMRSSSFVRKSMQTRQAFVELRTDVDTPLDVHATNFVRTSQQSRHARVKFRANADTKKRHGCVDFGTNADTNATYVLLVSCGRCRKLGCHISAFLKMTRNSRERCCMKILR